MEKKELFAGIDIGSVSTKAVLIDGDKDVVGRGICPSGIDFVLAAEDCLARAMESARALESDVIRTAATGYGRRRCRADMIVTEITCHAKAGYHFAGKACTVLDIGGQDSKIISVGEGGAVGDFKMNRKCAAGTGAFLEEMARRLDLSLDRINDLATEAEESAPLSSFCTVFAMTEALKRIHEGATPEAIARGVYESMVARTLEMTELLDSVVATGGVVEHHPIFVQLLEARAGTVIEVVPRAQFAGAFGAAILALAG